MTTTKKSVKSVSLKYPHLKMVQTHLFLLILYKLQMMEVFLFSSQHHDIIASGLTLKPNIV